MADFFHPPGIQKHCHLLPFGAQEFRSPHPLGDDGRINDSAIHWLEKSAFQGDVGAMSLLGRIYSTRYRNHVDAVQAMVEASEKAGLSRRVARLEPLICIKG